MTPRSPKETVSVSILITETPEGKLNIDFRSPAEAEGTVAGILGTNAVHYIREGLKKVGLDEKLIEGSRLQ